MSALVAHPVATPVAANRAADAAATAAVDDPGAQALAALQAQGLLDPARAPWRLDFHALDATQAERWQLVLAVSAQGPAVLLADRPCEPERLQAAERRLRRPLGWQVLPAPRLQALLALGRDGLRALDLVAPPPGADGAGQPDPTGRPSTGPQPQELDASRLHEAASPVVRLLDATLLDALRQGASDVHIEATAQGAEIRCRIDGVLQTVHRPTGVAVAEQLVSRLKVLAELDIGERRLPQDGRFRLRVQGREVDFRLSVIPSAHGEDAVLRVLDRQALERQHGALSLTALGLPDATRRALLQLAARPHGLLLVTGPTGSGKTTTLYALLHDTRRPGEKTVTIEDPVEYQLPGTTQIPVHERRGLDFARGLRAVLRHDPDRILVGEIRDTDTAAIAVQAALTGHAVLSSVHANGALEVIGRFLHMGIEPWQLVTALNGVLAQRLVRSICPHCAAPHPPQPHEQERLAALLGAEAADRARWRQGRGCGLCQGSGLRGRRAVVELLVLDDALRDAIARRAPLAEQKALAQRSGWLPLAQAAMAQVAAGHTTLAEVERVIGQT